MTKDDQKNLLSAIGRHVREQIEAATAPLQKQIDEMKEEAANFGYRGVWNDGSEYLKGNFVTHDGSLFHCNATTKNKPGRDPVSWSLCVKHGRDSKDVVRVSAGRNVA